MRVQRFPVLDHNHQASIWDLHLPRLEVEATQSEKILVPTSRASHQISNHPKCLVPGFYPARIPDRGEPRSLSKCHDAAPPPLPSARAGPTVSTSRWGWNPRCRRRRGWVSFGAWAPHHWHCRPAPIPHHRPHHHAMTPFRLDRKSKHTQALLLPPDTICQTFVWQAFPVWGVGGMGPKRPNTTGQRPTHNSSSDARAHEKLPQARFQRPCSLVWSLTASWPGSHSIIRTFWALGAAVGPGPRRQSTLPLTLKPVFPDSNLQKQGNPSLHRQHLCRAKGNGPASKLSVESAKALPAPTACHKSQGTLQASDERKLLDLRPTLARSLPGFASGSRKRRRSPFSAKTPSSAKRLRSKQSSWHFGHHLWSQSKPALWGVWSVGLSGSEPISGRDRDFNPLKEILPVPSGFRVSANLKLTTSQRLKTSTATRGRLSACSPWTPSHWLRRGSSTRQSGRTSKSLPLSGAALRCPASKNGRSSVRHVSWRAATCRLWFHSPWKPAAKADKTIPIGPSEWPYPPVTESKDSQQLLYACCCLDQNLHPTSLPYPADNLAARLALP